MKIERYDTAYRPFSKGMIKDSLGSYIKYSDYEKLEKQLQEQCIINLSISEQADEFKGKLIDSIESLIILIDSRLHLMDVKTIGKGKSHIWNTVLENALDLVKQSK